MAQNFLKDISSTKLPEGLHWAFTLNNYSDDDVHRLVSAVDTHGIKYLIIGKEVGSSGTPHLQGHVTFETKKRLTWITKNLGQAHYSLVRSIPHSIEYCKKDGNFTEYGTSPNVSSQQGKRSDLELFILSVREGMVDFKDLREAHPLVMAKYHRFALSYVRDHKPLPSIPDHPLYDWQSRLLETITKDPNSRDVIFVVDKTGNSGKSWFSSYCEKTIERTQVMKCGKRDDMAYELKEDLQLLIIDVSRSCSDFLNYQFIEDVKDGRVFSPKYESFTKRFNPPHVVVMMNSDPDESKLSFDRIKIINI